MKKAPPMIVGDDDDQNRPVVIRTISGDEEGGKRVEKLAVSSQNVETLKRIEKKLEDKGVQRLERHPVDGIGIRQPPPKSGHGGKYTWEGPSDIAEAELSPYPAAIDEGDPNYVDDDEEVDEEVVDLVNGEVEVAKTAEEGVARVVVDPRLSTNV